MRKKSQGKYVKMLKRKNLFQVWEEQKIERKSSGFIYFNVYFKEKYSFEYVSLCVVSVYLCRLPSFPYSQFQQFFFLFFHYFLIFFIKISGQCNFF